MYNSGFSSKNQKIPIDREPISRNTEEKIVKRAKRQWVIDCLQFLICLTLIVAVVLMYTKVSDVENERGVYNMDITTLGTGLSQSGAVGLLSSVCVSAIAREKSNINVTTSEEFFKNYTSMGSGVIIQLDKSNGSAYILTNYHVVANSGNSNYKKGYGYYYILPWDSDDPIKAELVGGSSVYDIAVLKVEGSKVLKECLCKQVSVAVSDEMAVGEECIAIGNSRGNDLRITTGVVSIEEMAFKSRDDSRVITYINHTADTNSGNSGGGLFNGSGELIGIVNAKYNNVNSDGTVTDSEVIQGMNYAIPSSIALSVAQNIIRNEGTLKRPEIGLELLTTYQWRDKAVDIDTETGKLRTNYTSYMRTTSGKFIQGDELLELSYTFEGRTVVAEITHINTIESHLYNLSLGDELTVKVKRGLFTQSITVTVSEQSDIA